ncbi:astacin-like metalloendopeptidase [Notamacropus eugenii]|uniref:astacin-like metalloendopeptidase n=1 Tax=Notamacropus eugenii TaxID=9315 RepID=UPI003B683419
MRWASDPWLLLLCLLLLVGGLDPTRPPEENATSFMNHVTPEGTQPTWDGDIPAINQGLIPEESPENSFLVEGDIIKAHPFQMFSAASFKWPKKDGIVEIPYLFSSKYDQPSREVILEAFADFEHFTCVRFVPRTNQNDFVSIIPMSGCFSSVGHSGGMQVASLAPFCLRKGKGIVLHELMHVLGFWHEHSRADRDRYIHISWKEIRPGFEINFIKSQNSNMLVPYDYTSVMHYGRYAFSKNGNTTIVPLAGPDIPIGQRWNLSTSDIVRVNRLYECSQTVKDSGPHSENKENHQKLGVLDLISRDKKKLHPTEASLEALPSLKAVSRPEGGDGVSPGWPVAPHSDHPWDKEVAKNTWPTWLILASSPGAAQLPELFSPSEAVPQESMENTPISLNHTETTRLVSEPVPRSTVPLLTVLPQGTMTSFPESKLLPDTHNGILVEMGERGGLPSTLIPSTGVWPEGTVPWPSGKASFSLELQSFSPDWRARPDSTRADIQTSHPKLGSIPGQLHGCQLCYQKEMHSAPTAGGEVLPSGGKGLLWRLLKALTMASASRNLPAIRGVRAGGRDQLLSAELRGDTTLPETLGMVFPARGTHNPEAPEEPARMLMEEEKLKRLAFRDVTSIPDIPVSHEPSPSSSQGSTWPSWESRHRNQLIPEKSILIQQPRKDNSSRGHVGVHFSGVKSSSSSHNLGWPSSVSPSPRGGIPALRKVNRGFMVPVTLSPGIASSGIREEFRRVPYTSPPVEKASFISPEGKLHSLGIQDTQGEGVLLSTLPTTNHQTPSSGHMALGLFSKSQTNKILAQMKSPLLAAFIQTFHLSHLMEDVTSNHFIFPVPPRKTHYLGTETPDEVFTRSGRAPPEVRTTTVDGKEVRQTVSPFTVGSAFPEREVVSPALSVNPILSLEDSGNQKPHSSGRMKQGGLGVAGKNWIPSFAPLRCLSGGIQLFLEGSIIPLFPVEPERIPTACKSKGTWTFLALGVEKKVAFFLSCISNSSNVTPRHPMPSPQSLEDPQSQTFFLVEAKPEILRQQKVPDPKSAASGIWLLKSPSDLLSLVPLGECQGLIRVRKSAYFPEPESVEKEYLSAFDENPSSPMVLLPQALKTQTLFLDGSKEDKGRDQLGITSIPLIQTKETMAHSMRDGVAQTLEKEYGNSKKLGGRDPKFPPFRFGFDNDALPLRNSSLGPDSVQGISDAKTLPALGIEGVRGTHSPLAASGAGPETVEWLHERGVAWTTVFHGEPRANEGLPEGRLNIQGYPKWLFLGPSLFLTGSGMEPEVTHNEEGREEGKTPSPSSSRAGHGNVPLTDYFNSRKPFSENLLHHMAWVGKQGVQSRPTDDKEHISQFLSHGSLPSVGREAVFGFFTTLRAERGAEEVRNMVGKSRSLAVSSAVNSERTKSASNQLHFVNLSSPLERLDQTLNPTKTRPKVHGFQGGKGELASFSLVGSTSPLVKTSDLSTRPSPSLFSPLFQHLQFARIDKLYTAAPVTRKTTTGGNIQKQIFPLQKSGFFWGPGKANIGHPDSRTPQTLQGLQSCDQAKQGRDCDQNQEGPASGDSSGNINSQGPRLGSVPHAGWLKPVSLVRLRAQKHSSEPEATSGHSWLCLDGGCWEVIFRALDSFQDLESLLARVFSSRSKSLWMEAAGTASIKDVQIPQVGLGSLQLPPHAESFHPDWFTQSPITGPHSMDKFSLRPVLPGKGTDPWSFDWFCDFETDFCGWQWNGTGAAWVFVQGQNSYPWSGSPTLESSCHFPGGNHLSLEKQTSPQTVPKAVLISPILHGARWVRFWYGPLQPGMGTISVYVYSRAQFGWHLIWSSAGYRSSSWSWVEMKLWASRKLQVMVEGVQGPEDGAHVSIDNLSVSSHQWSKGETKLPCHSFKKTLNKA